MTEMAEFVIRRILVALDASAHSLAALEEAASLAASMQAELAGLFVEDINLLRLAGLPFGRQISYPSGTEERLSTGRIARELKIRAERARNALAAAAERRHTPWTFRIVRGEVTAEIRAAASEADLILLGRAGWSPGRSTGLGSTALALAAQAPGALLLVQQGQRIGGPIVSVYDSSAGAPQALRTAVRLAHALTAGLVVFVFAETPEAGDQLVEEARRLANSRGKHTRFRRLASADPRRLAQSLRTEGDGLLVLAGSSPLAQEQAIRIFLQETRNPVLVIHRPQPAPSS